MNAIFYISAAIAVVSTAMAISRLNAVHALLYLIVSLLSVAQIFFILGAPFAAALEVIIYAGAIMVLFVFVIMMLNLGPSAMETERQWLRPGMWIGPVLLSAVLMAELVFVIANSGSHPAGSHEVGSGAVGIALFGPYALGVELASILLLAGLVGAYHLARQDSGNQSEGEV
ncbi:MAG: NADH-quinone oxidoreductase subunit J [Desulfobacteraceae bacterium]|nr:NADH-quinone oxidoreductase subunit J [Desulfobacteraceae bacterium]